MPWRHLTPLMDGESMENREGSRLTPKLTVLLELAWILVWTVWLGRAYLDLDSQVWPVGREFGMAIHPNFVWTQLTTCGDCVLWNAFPWHPFRGKPLSNRRPRTRELRHATDVLHCIVSLFPQAEFYAIGRVSQGVLKSLGIGAAYIRHPSHGGKRAFTAGVRALPRRDED